MRTGGQRRKDTLETACREVFNVAATLRARREASGETHSLRMAWATSDDESGFVDLVRAYGGRATMKNSDNHIKIVTALRDMGVKHINPFSALSQAHLHQNTITNVLGQVECGHRKRWTTASTGPETRTGCRGE